MLKIEWRSAFGYGDFVTGLGYAHTASIKYETDVQLRFHWDHDYDYKETPEDPDTIIERMFYVYSTMKQLPNVKILAEPNSKLPYRFKNNLDEYKQVHGLWYNNLDMKSTNVVVLWRSKYNTYFPGVDKDPAHDKWESIVEHLENQGYDVREITYRTPIQEVIENIRICKFGIGYDGMIHQLFKYLWKPLIVICKRHDLNKLLVPQACLLKSDAELKNIGVDKCVEVSEHRCTVFKERLEEWLKLKHDASIHQLYDIENGR